MGWLRDRLPYRASTRVKVALAVLSTALLTAPLAVFANHQFSDVPANHPFHKEIGVVADAGIAQGFSDGTYRPGINLTRQAMAAFLERGLGRLGQGTGFREIGTAPGYATQAVLARAGLAAGAAGVYSNGFAVLIGSATLSVSAASASACPCRVVVSLARNGESLTGEYVDIPGVVGESQSASASITIQSLVQMSGDETASYQLSIELVDSDAPKVSGTGTLTALYVPLGPDGDRTGQYENGCGGFEAEPNNTRGTATVFGPNVCVTGSLTANDTDIFTVVVGSGQTVTFETRSPDGAGCDGDTLIRTYDDQGFVMHTDDDNGIEHCSQLTYPSIAAGTYFLEVYAGDPSHTFEYQLRVSQSPV